MFNRFRRLLRQEQGITALETAIILIAFVVVASVFAFTILSAGTFSTERGKEAIYAGLSEVRGSMEVRGSVVAKGTAGVTGTLTSLEFTLANVAGGEPVDLTDGANRKVSIDYRDGTQVKSNIDWTVAISPTNNTNKLLEAGELARVTVNLTANSITTLSANTKFSLEIKPPSGPVILLERTVPAYVDAVMDLK
jgi:archaeal flagellin FlaB